MDNIQSYINPKKTQKIMVGGNTRRRKKLDFVVFKNGWFSGDKLGNLM